MMMSKIALMPETLANQIAAGEVVERPASVIKELIENALDAGSRHIAVDVEEAGLRLMRVVDDGEGMSGEELELAFLRHATSKLKNERDLFQIRTLGFRGEALPSIASVSRLRAISRPRGASTANMLVIEGGKRESLRTVAANEGTTIEVRDLFYNTPARLKFLKSLTTETKHMTDIMQRLALAHRRVHMRLTLDGRNVFVTPGDDDLDNTIVHLFGREVGEHLLYGFSESDDMRVEGRFGEPHRARSQRNFYFFVNGRPIRSSLLQKVLLDTYGTRLMRGAYPYVFLFIELDPQLVDVNVHPAKWEVRFSKEQKLIELVTHAASRALASRPLIPSAHVLREEAPSSKMPSFEYTGSFPSVPASKKRLSQDGKQPNLFPEASQDVHRIKRATQLFLSTLQQTDRKRVTPTAPAVRDPSSLIDVDDSVDDRLEKRVSNPNVHQRSVENNAGSSFPVLMPLAQLHDSYIIAEGPDGLYLVDQHAAAERIRYETLLRAHQQAPLGEEVRTLLWPIELTLPTNEGLDPACVLQVLEAFHFQGTLSADGSTLSVTAYPAMLNAEEVPQVIKDLLDEAFLGSFLASACDPASSKTRPYDRLNDKNDQAEDGSNGTLASLDATGVFLTKIATRLAEKLKTQACHSSVTAQERLSMEEMNYLLRELARCETPYVCPHGRPVVVHFSLRDLEKMFRRTV